MWDWFVDSMRSNPSLPVFLSLGLGYWIGRFKYKNFSLGSVTSVLLVAVVVGLLKIEISRELKNTFFYLFLFAIGYNSGPSFFANLKKQAAAQISFAIVMALACLFAAWGVARALGYNTGYAAGLLAGACTESLIVGVATDALNTLSLAPGIVQQWSYDIPVAYAVTYLFGTAGTIWCIAYLAPVLLGVKDIKEEARKLESMLGQIKLPPQEFYAFTSFDNRAYRVENSAYTGKTVYEVEEEFSQSLSFLIMAVERDGEIVAYPQLNPELMLREGDIIEVRAHTVLFADEAKLPGPEVYDKRLGKSVILETMDAVLTRKKLNGATLESFMTEPLFHGVVCTKIMRGLQELPVLPGTEIYAGDVFTLVGPLKAVEYALPEFGYAQRPSSATDMTTVALGIFVGALVGLLTLHVGSIPLSLSTSGGALIAGLLLGWGRCRYPVFGNLPSGALWIFNSLGLCLFIACVGIASGPHFAEAIRENGFGLFGAGIVVTLVPLVLCLYFGKYVLKMNPIINMGALCGARMCTAAIEAVNEVCGSRTPTLGYTIPFALNNIIFAV